VNSTIPSLREKDPRRRIIVALDTSSADEALRLADRLRPECGFVKVGLQLFVASGPSVVAKLASLGFSIFLDLKFHDIPNTMAGAVKSVLPLNVRLTTVHAGALEGVAAAAEAAASVSPSIGILGVTVLTSHPEGALGNLYGSPLDTAETVLRLGRAAIEQGAHGLVASPKEIVRLREELGGEPLLVIPGIRPAGADIGDQSRVATPAQAMSDGADYLVIGRPITGADDPRDAFLRIVDEIAPSV
jgi:orotidine-5'-phosphate decarboxylase